MKPNIALKTYIYIYITGLSYDDVFTNGFLRIDPFYSSPRSNRRVDSELALPGKKTTKAFRGAAAASFRHVVTLLTRHVMIKL